MIRGGSIIFGVADCLVAARNLFAALARSLLRFSRFFSAHSQTDRTPCRSINLRFGLSQAPSILGLLKRVLRFLQFLRRIARRSGITCEVNRLPRAEK